MSVFHQLHCLVRYLIWHNPYPLRTKLTRLQNGILKAFLNDKDKLPWAIPHPMAHDDPHIFHCFDYLRQAIMCCGYTALEGADVYEQATGTDTFSQGTFGIGTTHVCKNYEEIYQYAEENGLVRSLQTHL